MTTILTPPIKPAGPPPLSDGGRSALRAAIVVAATVTVVGTIACLGFLAWGLSAFRVVTDHQTLPATIRTLTLDTANSPVAVRITADRAASTPRVDLRMIATGRSDDQRLAVTNDGAGTNIRVVGASSEFLPWGDPGELTITVPPEVGRRLALTVRQDTGVLITQADLDQLTASTTDGSVVLRGAVRRVEVHAQDGNVAAREPFSVTESFNAVTVDGDIAVDFGETAPRRVDATTRDGDVSISLPAPGPYLVRAQSGGSATVRVPETSDPARAVAEVTVRSEDGNVAVDTRR